MKPIFPEPKHEPSQAVIASNGTTGVVLWYTGRHLTLEIDEAGLGHDLGDLGLDDAPEGISIWEGIYLWSPGGYENPEDGESYPKGNFRQPTEKEWASIRLGEAPWAKPFSNTWLCSICRTVHGHEVEHAHE